MHCLSICFSCFDFKFVVRSRSHSMQFVEEKQCSGLQTFQDWPVGCVNEPLGRLRLKKVKLLKKFFHQYLCQ